MTGTMSMQKKLQKTNFDRYATTILKQLDNTNSHGMSNGANGAVTAMIKWIIQKVIAQAAFLIKPTGNSTLTDQYIASAFELITPAGREGQRIFAHIDQAGNKAVTTYNASARVEGAKKVRASDRAGIAVSVSRVENFIREQWCNHVAKSAPVYLAGAIDFILEDVLRIALDNAEARGKRNITVKDLTASVRELAEGHFLRSIVLSTALPMINKPLISEKTLEKIEKRKKMNMEKKKAAESGSKKSSKKKTASKKKTDSKKRKASSSGSKKASKKRKASASGGKKKKTAK